MPVISSEYQKKVLDDIKSYEGLSKPVKASLPERLFIRSAALSKLHPNPTDEFSQAEIGPNYEIVRRYEEEFRHAVGMNHPPLKDKLTVEKMSAGGYMLMNGHHRWYAATRVAGIRRVPVEVVNLSTEETILSALKGSQRDKCVSFDLDEVLLTDGSTVPADRKLIFPFSRFYPLTLRKNAGVLIRSLREQGFDVWVYTGGFSSEGHIRRLFRLHGCDVDGVITVSYTHLTLPTMAVV